MKKALAFLLPFAILLLSSCTAQGDFSLSSGVDLSPAMQTILQVVTALVMIGGLFSLFLFVIPGLSIIWLAALAYGLLTGFDLASTILFLTITLLMAFGNIVDQLFMGAKAKQSGASWKSVILSMLAAFIGSLIFPPFGGIIAALAVLFVFEYLRLRDLRKASDSTGQMAIGCATAAVARFFIGLVMIGLWVVWVWQSGELPF
ncbi:MAG: DUF456 domain-containing protein [Chloroflexi bacterium]|nr:DUF456 domain-containing protein [Chloroflexota bacterium]